MKTSVYLTDQLATAVAVSGIPLARLIRRGLLAMPHLTETSPNGDFITRWYCDVPAKDARFRVIADEWNEVPGQVPVRDVYEIVVTDPDHCSDE